MYDGQPVPGSPFVTKVFDANAIVIGKISPGIVGKAVEFSGNFVL